MIWNVLEAVVAIAAGTRAGSLALVGFGLDSTIEVGSAVVILWQFAGREEERERRALRLIAFSFFALAAYVSVQAVIALATSSKPRHDHRWNLPRRGVAVGDAGSRLCPASHRPSARVGHRHRRQPNRLGCAHICLRCSSSASY